MSIVNFVLVLACAALINAQRACTDVGQVQYVQAFPVGPNLVVVWQEPANAIDCPLTYKVEYTSLLSTQVDTTDELHYTFDYQSAPCDLGQVTITPIVNDVEGAVYNIDYGTAFGAVTDISLSEESGLLQVTWSDPSQSELCDFTYVIEYVDEINTFSVETNDKSVVFESSLTPCLSSTVTVTAVNNAKAGPKASREYETAVGLVRNFALESTNGEILAKFDPPANIDRCVVTYEVNESEKECFTKRVSVWAVNESGKEGLSQAGEIETEIPAVEDLTVNYNRGIVSVAWTKQQNADQCGIKYIASIDGSEGVQTDSTAVNVEANLLPCRVTEVSVWPLSTSGKLGVVSTVSYERSLGTVNNLAMELVDGKLVATWEAPSNSDLCILSYLVDYDDGTGSHITVVDATEFSFDYSSCNTAEITVTPHTERGTEGQATSVSYKQDCRQ